MAGDRRLRDKRKRMSIPWFSKVAQMDFNRASKEPISSFSKVSIKDSGRVHDSVKQAAVEFDGFLFTHLMATIAADA